MIYANRKEAGRKLAEELRRFSDEDNAVAFALPRGGIVLAAEVAKKLDIPLGLILVRKIGHPYFREYAIGAVVEDEKPVYNDKEASQVADGWLEKAEKDAKELIRRRRKLYYNHGFKPPEVEGRTAIIIDDGIATGLTMEAAVKAMKHRHARRVIAAAPVASSDSVEKLRRIADEVVILDNPDDFVGAVGAHYREFRQVDDEEVQKLLRRTYHELHQTTA